MAQHTIQLSVPEPCFESWKEMQPNCDGRFCNVCQKVVVDFATMSDERIVNYLAEAGKARVCVRVKKSQLNRPISGDVVTKPKLNIVGLFSRLAAVLILAPASEAVAQAVQQQKGAIRKEIHSGGHQSAQKNTPKLYGRLLNRADNSPIAGATVKAMGKTTHTDSAGNFQFTMPGNYAKKYITVSASVYENGLRAFSIRSVTIATTTVNANSPVTMYGDQLVFIAPRDTEEHLMGVNVAELVKLPVDETTSTDTTKKK